jgi:hypothetical protein
MTRFDWERLGGPMGILFAVLLVAGGFITGVRRDRTIQPRATWTTTSTITARF